MNPEGYEGATVEQLWSMGSAAGDLDAERDIYQENAACKIRNRVNEYTTRKI